MMSKPDTDSLGRDISPSKYFLDDQKFFILGSAVLSLLVVWPNSLEIAMLTIAIGTPLFWSLFGMSWVHQLVANKFKIVRFLIIVSIFLAYSYILKELIVYLSKLI